MFRELLIIEDEPVLAKNIKRYLERHDYVVRVAADGEEGLKQFEEFKPDLVLLDFNLPGMNGLELLTRIRELDSLTKVILISAHGNVEVAVSAMKAGADDYLSKPLVLGELKLIIDKAIGQQRLEGALSYYRDREAGESGLAKILGKSPALRQSKQRIMQLLEAERRLTDDELPAVLITGETGTGKELVARALHYDSLRKDHPFFEINCAAIPTQLLESELLGYERGAFTGARERKPGLVESAHGGTLFLDEISETDPAIQAKLLKLLEDKTVRRLGSVRDRKVSTRIITSTNRSLEELVEQGKFRSDLYFRLHVISLELPPLRERGEDVLLLAKHFLEFHGRRYRKQGLTFSAAARRAIMRHAWPGNVRELRNVMEQAVLMAPGTEISPEQLLFYPSFELSDLRQSGRRAEAPPAPSDHPTKISDVEKSLIIEALKGSGGNVTRAAKVLGISRDTLRYRMEKHQLHTRH